MGRTRPRRVISPVMARSLRTGRFKRAETMDVARVMPAEGPSLGVAPSGTCTWMSMSLWKSRLSPKASERERM